MVKKIHQFTLFSLVSIELSPVVNGKKNSPIYFVFTG